MIAFDTYSGSTGRITASSTGRLLLTDPSFCCLWFRERYSIYYVTEAYDMNGLTPRFNLTDPSVQKYKSTVTDGAPWNLDAMDK